MFFLFVQDRRSEKNFLRVNSAADPETKREGFLPADMQKGVQTDLTETGKAVFSVCGYGMEK